MIFSKENSTLKNLFFFSRINRDREKSFSNDEIENYSIPKRPQLLFLFKVTIFNYRNRCVRET